MSTFAIPHALVGLLTTVMAAGWVSSPMSWSPDSRWLSYTVAPEAGPGERPPGWLFDATREGPPGRDRDARGLAPAKADTRPGPYRIWASRRDGEQSVLIEESAAPLTAATWSPRGRSVAFGRFVPDSTARQPSSPMGQFDVVIQDGLNRRRTLLAMPGFELDDATRDQFPHMGPSWSPDGQYLAFPKPGPTPSILIIKVDSRRLLRTLEQALVPAWSPDGTKLAFLRPDESGYSLHVLERNGQTFTAERAILPMGRIAAPVSWGEDGRSILAVMERSGLRMPDLDLVSVKTDTGEELRIFPMAPEALRRGAAIRGVAIDFSRDEELCFFSVDFEGRDTHVMWTVPRERLPYKPFHPLDQSIRVGSLAIAPDGHSLAMRFGTPGGLSPPAIYQLPTEQTTERTMLLVPDESARHSWLALLSRTSRALLVAALPAALADGQSADRPTLLPLPDDIQEDPLRKRLARLGRYGASICRSRGEREDPIAETESGSESALEDRLFFDYLSGDFTAAWADLEALEPLLATRERRLALLSLKAQVLWSRGEMDGARDVAGYLLESVGGPVHRYEETPTGRSLAPEPGSGRSWARYLATRASQTPSPAAPPASPPPVDQDFGLPFVEPGPAAIPVAPNLPGDAGPFRGPIRRLEAGGPEGQAPPPRP